MPFTACFAKLLCLKRVVALYASSVKNNSYMKTHLNSDKNASWKIILPHAVCCDVKSQAHVFVRIHFIEDLIIALTLFPLGRSIFYQRDSVSRDKS